MKNIYIAIFLVILSTFNVVALTAKEALEKTAKTINDASAISLDFEAKNDEQKSLTGNMLLSHGKFVVSGKGYGTWFDGNDMWSYLENTGEVNISTPTEEELMETNPFEVINSVKNTSTAKMLSNRNGICTLLLTPTDKMSIKNAQIEINTQTWLPKSIYVVFDNGTTMKIIITRIAVEKNLPSIDSFKFPQSKYPNAEVVDLR